MGQEHKTNFFISYLFLSLLKKLSSDPAEVLDKNPAEIVNDLANFSIVFRAHAFYLILNGLAGTATQKTITPFQFFHNI